ncbi:MAG TPA: carbohydrate ABC transporter permease, partial [Clostridia bacterium]|nr:carbohydrate ABC transporter permease [Clostridia bacterium]
TRGDALFDAAVAAVLLLILLVILYPIYFVLIASLSSPMLVFQGKVWFWIKGLTLEAYRLVFRDSRILTSYMNTIQYTVIGTGINLVLSTAAAYPLSRRSLKGKNAFMAMMTFTMFFSGGMIPTYILVNSIGLIDTLPAMVLPNAISVYNVIILRTFFIHSIPAELEESAYVDGASQIRTLLSILLPLSKPVMAVMVLYYAVAHWNAYYQALLYLRHEDKFPLQLVLRQILILSQVSDESFADVMDLGSRKMLSETMKYALIVVATGPILLLYPFVQKYFVKGVMIGSVKG